MLKVATKFVPEPRGFEIAIAAGFRSAKFCLGGSSLDQWLEIAREARQHSIGYASGCDEQRPMYCSREMVLTFLSLLADHEFDGFVVSEVNAPFQNVRELEMDILLFERWRELHGEDRSTIRTTPRLASYTGRLP